MHSTANKVEFCHSTADRRASSLDAIDGLKATSLPPVGDIGKQVGSRVNLALFVSLAISFALSAGYGAAVRPYWMDEILAVWTARMPTIWTIWDALGRGADYSPPLYHVALHSIIQLGGGDAFTLRLPSILATFSTATTAFVLTRRRYSASIALIAMALCLTSSLFWFSMQARPYALVTACFALALLLWDVPTESRPSWRRAAAIFVLLTTAVGMHFYAVLLAATIGLMEAIWTIAYRRFRWAFVAAIGLACTSVFLWLPLMRTIMSLSNGETGAAEYYARPTLLGLVRTYQFLLIGPNLTFAISPLTILLFAIVAPLFMLAGTANKQPLKTSIDNLDIIVTVTCAIPILIFAFSAIVTHTFHLRYVLAAVLGLSILAARLVARLPRSTTFAYLTVVVAVGLSLHAFATATPYSPAGRDLALVNRAPATLPIATGDGMLFFELREGTNSKIADRAAFITLPAEATSPDPTNARAVERWSLINPSIVVSEFGRFINSHPQFVMLHDTGAVDPLPGLVAARGCTVETLARQGTVHLADVKCMSEQ